MQNKITMVTGTSIGTMCKLPSSKQKSAACQLGAADFFIAVEKSMTYTFNMNTSNKIIVGLSVAILLTTSTSAFAQERGVANAGLSASVLTCVQTAIDTRDNAIIAAWDVQYPAVKTALQTRQAALKAAWAQTDQKTRREATRTAWSTYKESAKSARATMKAAHKAAWTAFEATRKACSPKATKDDNGSLGMDSQL